MQISVPIEVDFYALPCPNCGSENHYITNERRGGCGNRSNGCAVYCVDCFLIGPDSAMTMNQQGILKAIELWDKLPRRF
jgi:hypothetical protein